jgi:hypothetical protein
VIQRAWAILEQLEGEHLGGVRAGVRAGGRDSRVDEPVGQLALFAPAHPVVDRLVELDVNTITPIDALTILARLVDEAKRSR